VVGARVEDEGQQVAQQVEVAQEVRAWYAKGRIRTGTGGEIGACQRAGLVPGSGRTHPQVEALGGLALAHAQACRTVMQTTRLVMT
jgi:hypothetical protein